MNYPLSGTGRGREAGEVVWPPAAAEATGTRAEATGTWADPAGDAPAAASVTGVFRAHHAELVRLAVLLLGDREPAEDVVQDVFARLCGRDLLPDGDGARLRAVRALGRNIGRGRGAIVVI